MTDYWNANTINDMIRSIFALLDRVAYWLLGIMYEILFNVASADIFSNETIKNFYGRIQLILGVFMIFKLAVTIIQGIINPDTFTDKKSGFGNIITRIVTAIIILAVLTPINIPSPRNDYEVELNNNGLLFGTLYSLQTRILENNTLGRLILGTTDNATSPTGGTGADTQAERLTQSANTFTATILKGFVRINMKEGKTDETKASDRICEYIDDKTLAAYTALDADPNQILSLVNASCEYQGGGFSDVIGAFKRLAGKDRYVFAYMPVISTLVAALFIYILLGEIVTIAIRSIKLAVLRLIAPIPVISYIQPSKDGGSFGAWTKALTSTYLELFLHLAVIYFIIFLIQDMIVNGIVINTSGGIIGIISMIFIWIGMFFFIRMAPKFMMNVLGIKSGGGNFGVGGLLAMTGAKAAGATWADSMRAYGDSANANIKSYNEGKQMANMGTSFNFGRDTAAQLITGNDKMTYNKWQRGMGQLAEEGITPWEADKLHNAAIASNAFTERMASDAEAGRYTYMDETGATQNYHWRDNHGTVHNVTNDAEMSLALSQQRSISGTLQANDGKVDKRVGLYGQSRSYRYKKRRPNTAVGSGDPFGIHQGTSNRYNNTYNGGRTFTPGGNNAAGYDTTTHN